VDNLAKLEAQQRFAEAQGRVFSKVPGSGRDDDQKKSAQDPTAQKDSSSSGTSAAAGQKKTKLDAVIRRLCEVCCVFTLYLHIQIQTCCIHVQKSNIIRKLGL